MLYSTDVLNISQPAAPAEQSVLVTNFINGVHLNHKGVSRYKISIYIQGQNTQHVFSIILSLYSLCTELQKTDPDCTVVISSANRLVGTGFASRYRIQHRDGFLKAQWATTTSSDISDVQLLLSSEG